MKQIRNKIFETNSSSTHSIAIPKEIASISIPNHIYFYFGEYGWEFGTADPASYLYTAIVYGYEEKDAEEYINKIKEVLDKNNIKYTFEEPKYSKWGLESGSIDHVSELFNFIDEIVNNEDMLIRYLSSGYIFTGNDNSDEDDMAYVYRDKKTYKKSYLVDKKNWTWASEECENPYYIGDGYDWYFKGN